MMTSKMKDIKEKIEKGEAPTITDYIDVIEEVKAKVHPVFVLMSQSANSKHGSLTPIEVDGLGWLLRDLFENVFEASDGIYKIWIKENGYKDEPAKEEA